MRYLTVEETNMAVKEIQRRTPEQVKEDLQRIRSEWLVDDVEEGFAEVERGEYVTIDIDEQKREYRVAK